jgi:uncharacterized membrane protein
VEATLVMRGVAAVSARRPARNVVALTFASPLLAQQALLATLRLEEQGRLALHDAVFVQRSEHGLTEVTETTDPTPLAAAIPSSLLGAVVGTLVAGPVGFIIGGVLAGGTGALAARWIDTGIPDDLVSRLRDTTPRGQCVLALLVSGVSEDDLADQLRMFEGARLL